MKPKDDNHWTSNGPQVEFPVQQKSFFPPQTQAEIIDNYMVCLYHLLN